MSVAVQEVLLAGTVGVAGHFQPEGSGVGQVAPEPVSSPVSVLEPESVAAPVSVFELESAFEASVLEPEAVVVPPPDELLLHPASDVAAQATAKRLGIKKW